MMLIEMFEGAAEFIMFMVIGLIVLATAPFWFVPYVVWRFRPKRPRRRTCPGICGGYCPICAGPG